MCDALARAARDVRRAAEHQNAARKRACSSAASRPWASTAKSITRSRSASASRTSATDRRRERRLRRGPAAPGCERTYARNAAAVRAPRVADAAAPPLVALGHLLGQRVQVRVEVAVDRAREHQVRVLQRSVWRCFGPWCTSARNSCTRARCSVGEARERAVGAGRQRAQVRLQLVLAAGLDAREGRQRVGAADPVAALTDAPARR